LRQALWQLHIALDPQGNDGRVLLVDPEWIRINSEIDLWLDVAEFEQACAALKGIPGQQLAADSASRLQNAADVYEGDLLEDCYEDWCLYERERLQNLYLGLVGKLMAYCEAHGEFEAGLAHGERILRLDRASERTHRQLMRLHYLGGDRTGALRQFSRCVAALDEELDVKPARSTVMLYEQIRDDRLDGTDVLPMDHPTGANSIASRLAELFSRFDHFATILGDVQSQLQEVRKELRVLGTRPHNRR
jgi:DNA-binding SARP family transcriptional activator